MARVPPGCANRCGGYLFFPDKNSDDKTFLLASCPTDVGRILRTFKIKKNVEVTDNGKIII